MVLRTEALRERLAKLEEIVSRLDEIAGVNRDEFERDYRQQWVVGARLHGLGGFRNILVHGYLTIDCQKIFAALQRSVRDFTDFEAEVLKWLDRSAAR